MLNNTIFCYIYSLTGTLPNVSFSTKGANNGYQANISCTLSGWPIPDVYLSATDGYSVSITSDNLDMYTRTLQLTTNDLYHNISVNGNATNSEGWALESVEIISYGESFCVI